MSATKRSPSRKSLAALKAVNDKRVARAKARKTPAKSFRNTEKPWKKAEVQELAKLAHLNTPTRVIGLKLGRTENSIYSKAADESISLKPSNRSPRTRSRPALPRTRRRTLSKKAA